MIGLVLQSLKIQRKKFVFIIVQFTVAFAAILISFSFMNSMRAYRERAQKILPLTTYHLCTDAESNTESNAECAKIFKQMENEGISAGIFSQMNLSYGDGSEVDRVLMANRTYLLYLKDNSEFEKIDELIRYSDEEHEIPIIAGSGYADYFEPDGVYEFEYINDNFECENIKVKVVEIAKKDSRLFRGNHTCLTDTVEPDGRYILFPEFTDFRPDAYDYNLVTDSKENCLAIMDFFQKNGVELQAKQLKEEVKENLQTKLPVVVATLIFAIIIITLSILGCIGTFLSSILNRKKEFGIYYSLGITKKKLRHMVLLEGLCIFSISMLIALLIADGLVISLLSQEGAYISILDVFTTAGLMLVCGGLCEILPLRSMNQMEPVELVNGTGK